MEHDPPSPPADRALVPSPVLTRRRLLQVLGTPGGAAVLAPIFAAALGERAAAETAGTQGAAGALPIASTAGPYPPGVPPWMRQWGPLASPYGERSPYERDVVRELTSGTNNSFTPLSDLYGTLTPNSLFFERTHAGIPPIDPAQHRLLVHGLVERPTLFTMDDLTRFPAVSVVHFLECSGNSDTEYNEATLAATVQESHGFLGGAEWTGVPLRTILAEVGVQPRGTWLLCEGADAAGMDRSVPIEKAMADGLLAYGQNGEALRPSQGYPLRLILPGWEGNINIKWLRRIKIGDRPWQTREETSKYTDLLPSGLARQYTFVMEAKSVITTPAPPQLIAAPGFREIRGLAWSGRGKITRVDVSTDGGHTWAAATLQEPVLPISLTRFHFPWRWDGAPARLQSRCIDETGYVQPAVDQLVAAHGTNSFYHFNGIKTWAVGADGEVTNVYR